MSNPKKSNEIIDQYGEIIPNDLVVIPPISGLDLKEIELIDDLEWYEVEGYDYIFVSESQMVPIRYPLDDLATLKDVVIDETGINILKVDQYLHRWGLQDGFYHA
jgi:hypothetical protein